MAIINVEIDSEKDSMKVTLDGKKVPDVKEFRAHLSTWSDTPEVHVEIVSGDNDKDAGIRSTTIVSVGSEMDKKISILPDEFKAELSSTLLTYNKK